MRANHDSPFLRDPDVRGRLRSVAAAAAAFPLLIVLPVLGIRLAGKPAGLYLEFPPTTQYVQHAAFSWAGFAVISAVILMMIVPIIARSRRNPLTAGKASRTHQPFPWWGWLGVALGTAVWVLAWTRYEWMSACQPFTFSPLWLAYILVVNALTFRQSGRCLLTHRPFYLLSLFPVSAAFWWFFEYLNRFVQNWYYEGVASMTPLQYFAMATLPFSTVLPAVTSTFELLETRLGASPEWLQPAAGGRRAKVLAGAALASACAGLVGIGTHPDLLFPLLWLAPLFVVASLQVLVTGHVPVFDGGPGKWLLIRNWALAALICGFFWEMWNDFSLAKWIYTVPYVNRFRIFEMPLLGYAGYLPFGLECAVVAGLVERLTGLRHEKG